MNFRDVEGLLAERAIIVFYETIRIWCQKFGPGYARSLKRVRVASATPGIWTSLYSNQWPTTLSLAGRGSRRRRNRHPGSASPRSTRGRTVLSKTPARPRKRTVSDYYRQTEKLLGRPVTNSRRRCPQHRTIRQQSRRSFSSAYPPKGTADVPIQICWSGATIPYPSRRRPESLPTGTALANSDESSTFAFAILRYLENGDSGLKSLSWQPPTSNPNDLAHPS